MQLQLQEIQALRCCHGVPARPGDVPARPQADARRWRDDGSAKPCPDVCRACQAGAFAMAASGGHRESAARTNPAQGRAGSPLLRLASVRSSRALCEFTSALRPARASLSWIATLPARMRKLPASLIAAPAP